MNEHIKQLAEQAWDATAVSPDFGHPVSFAEKFAELIVRECAELVETQHTWITSVAASALIRKHFGVEL